MGVKTLILVFSYDYVNYYLTQNDGRCLGNNFHGYDLKKKPHFKVERCLLLSSNSFTELINGNNND